METKTYTYTWEANNGNKHEIPFTVTSESKIYAIVRGVSRSGMSRRLSFFMVDDGALINITQVIAQCLGYTLNEREWSFRVSGCGMDMIFDTLYRFAKKIGFKEMPSWVNNYGRI